MADYIYEDESDPDLSSICSGVAADGQIQSHVDTGGEGHHLSCRWDEDTPESGVGTLTIRWSGTLCSTCESALDTIIGGL